MIILDPFHGGLPPQETFREGLSMKTLAVFVVLVVVAACALWQARRAASAREAAQVELAEAMIEVERLEARAAALSDVIHDLRAGRVD